MNLLANTPRRWVVSRHQVLILMIGAAMAVSFFMFVLWPQHCELWALDKAVEQERTEVNQKVLTSQMGVYVAARIPSLRRAQQVLERRLPVEPKVAEFLQTVAERVAAEPQVSHEVLKADPPASAVWQTDGPAAVSVRIRLSGPFAGVYRCLGQIEAAERLNCFRRLRIARSDSSDHVVAEADVLLYYFSGGPHAVRKPAASAKASATRT